MCIIRLIEFYWHYAVLEKIKGNITFRHSNCKNSKYSNCTERLFVARLERVTRVGRVGKHHESNVCKRNGLMF